MSVRRELRESGTLVEDEFCQIRSHDLKQLEMRIEDLSHLLQIAKDQEIEVWQVIAVATTRLRRDIDEHYQQTLMGI